MVIVNPKNKTQLHVFYKKPTWNVKTYAFRAERKINFANTKKGRAGVAILMSDRSDFKTMKVIRDKEDYIMLKRSVLQKQ